MACGRSFRGRCAGGPSIRWLQSWHSRCWASPGRRCTSSRNQPPVPMPLHLPSSSPRSSPLARLGQYWKGQHLERGRQARTTGLRSRGDRGPRVPGPRAPAAAICCPKSCNPRASGWALGPRELVPGRWPRRLPADRKSFGPRCTPAAWRGLGRGWPEDLPAQASQLVPLAKPLQSSRRQQQDRKAQPLAYAPWRRKQPLRDADPSASSCLLPRPDPVNVGQAGGSVDRQVVSAASQQLGHLISCESLRERAKLELAERRRGGLQARHRAHGGDVTGAIPRPLCPALVPTSSGARAARAC